MASNAVLVLLWISSRSSILRAIVHCRAGTSQRATGLLCVASQAIQQRVHSCALDRDATFKSRQDGIDVPKQALLCLTTLLWTLVRCHVFLSPHQKAFPVDLKVMLGLVRRKS
jgi:hypothetical protein